MQAVEVCPACGYPVYGDGMCFACQPFVAVRNDATEPRGEKKPHASRVARVLMQRSDSEPAANAS